MTVAVDTRTLVEIHLEGDCETSSHCAALAKQLHEQLDSGAYRWPCSALELPESLGAYLVERRTARKRANQAQRLGYRFERIDRSLFEQDVFEINTSAPERQGRPMSAGYLQPVTFSPLPDYTCPRHGIHTYGVLDAGGSLRAYTWVYRVGELVMFSSILGHADHLEREIMYLLMVGALGVEITEHGPGVAWYNRHDSGTEGLRFFKERCGFRPVECRWHL